MEIKPKLYKLIKRFITQSTKGSDVFIHNGSKWIIFVEDKKWVIELTKEGTLWYNYYFFQNIFELVDLDVVENQHYITKWVEDNVINGVIYTVADESAQHLEVEDTIQNGVKQTKGCPFPIRPSVEDTIQNGVKHTEKSLQIDGSCVIEDVIKEGVKHTEYGDWLDGDERFDDVIRDGVKETWGCEKQSQDRINEVIENGTKENPD